MISILQGYILLRLVNTSKKPAIFLMIYVAVFYLEFEFNVLRAGTAIMFLVLASRYVLHFEKTKFFILGFSAILMHYSAFVGFLILVFLRGDSRRDKLLTTLLSAVAALVNLYFFTDEFRLNKFLVYSESIAKESNSSFGVGFIAIQFLYILYYVSVVKEKTFASQTFLLVLWLILMWAAISFSFVDRIKIIVSALFLFLGIESTLSGWRSRLRSYVILGIAVVSLLGNLKNIENISSMKDLDFNYASSPFVPYKFMWEQ